MRRLTWLLVALSVWAGAGQQDIRADGEPPPLEKLRQSIAGTGNDRERADTAEAIAEQYYDPEALVAWLEERLTAESDFHVRLAIAYALAAQGERAGLVVLVDSLKVMGHLGYVYLTRISGNDFGGPGVGWNRPSWVQWLAQLQGDTFREYRRQANLRREPSDGDAEGLERAIAWWDGLSYPDVAALPFVRVMERTMRVGDEEHDTWSYGFLVREDPASFTVFGTDLRETRRDRARNEHQVWGRYEKIDLVQTVAAELAMLAGGSAGHRFLAGGCVDPFGVDFYLSRHRHEGFVLACAAHKRGAKDLALRVWKHVAQVAPGSPRYGRWVAVDVLRQNAAVATLRAWERRAEEPERSWSEALAEYRLWRRRHGSDTVVSETDLLTALEGMATEEATYAEWLRDESGTPAERARRLVRTLPETRRTVWYDRLLGDARGGPEPDDAYRRLVDMGADAVPALLSAFDDPRPTRVLEMQQGGKAYIRVSFTQWRVRDLVLRALSEIAQRKFGQGSRDRGEIRKEVETWWASLQEQGEERVLIAGVMAADESSPAQARRLARVYPVSAFVPIRSAWENAAEGVAPQLLLALGCLKTPQAAAFLLARAQEGRLRDRIAAATSLDEQGDARGVAALLADWPTIAMGGIQGSPGLPTRGAGPTRELVELLFRLDARGALQRMTTTLGETPGPLKYELIDRIHEALGHELFYERGRPPARTPSQEVVAAVEAFLVRLVLDTARREGTVSTYGPGSAGGLQTNLVGEAAAEKLAYVWPGRYAFDAAAGASERVEQRYAIVNAWRKAHDEPPLPTPERLRITPVPRSEMASRLAAWSASSDSEERQAEEAKILALGLGTLPALKAECAAETDANRRARLVGLVRYVARIVREVNWRENTPAPGKELRERVEALKGQPIRGSDVTDLLRAASVEPVQGATGIDIALDSTGDGTGFVLTVALTTHRVDWSGGAGGYVLSGDGQELVDRRFLSDPASWWHQARSGQIHALLDRPADVEVHLRRVIAAAR